MLKAGEAKAIGPRAFDLLVDLLDHPGRVLEKSELIDRVWGGVAVTDNALTRAIKDIREAIGDSAGQPRYVETVARRGYRLIAHVRRVDASPRTMLVVLPFVDLSREPEEFFCDGLTEELITRIARLNADRLGVIARTSAMTYKATTKTAGVIARELGVDYLLEGSLRRESGRLRITVQLIDAHDERHVWAESFDDAIGDVLRVQADTAEAVARAIRIELQPDGRSLPTARERIDPDAYTAYLRGRYLWNRRAASSIREGITEFHRAIAGAPNFAPAHVGLARCCASFFLGVLPRADVEPIARTAVARALELDDQLAEAYAVRAALESGDGDLHASERTFRHALRLDPNDASIHHWYAMQCLVTLGRFDEALDELLTAQALDPLSLIVSADVAAIWYMKRNAPQAMAQCRRVLRLDPTFARAHVYLGWVHVFTGALREAVAEFEIARTLDSSPWTAGWLGYGYGRLGRAQEAGQILSELRHLAAIGTEVAFYEAVVQLGLGDTEQSMACLERARGERSLAFGVARYFPLFDPLRADPRFGLVLDCVRRREPSSPIHNRAALVRYVAATNARQPVASYFAPGYRYHGPTGTLDRDAFLRQHDAFLAAFPDVHLCLQDIVAEGDQTVARWCAEGTHLGVLMGMPPTGRRVRITGIIVSRFQDGLAVEEWEEIDLLGLMRQIGH